uniref:TPR_REGION domain-containing protein n=1 Tax=Steinernema glaseri TaxID=37863 RepID=A0A1I7Y205_9BILA
MWNSKVGIPYTPGPYLPSQLDNYIGLKMDGQKVPCLSEEEKQKFHRLSSFQYVVGQQFPSTDQLFLFKVNRIMEADLMKITAKKPEERSQSRLHFIYLKLGHVNLLAGDYAKALSAYQKAYKANTEHFWEDPSGYYGLGLVYFHFKAFKLSFVPVPPKTVFDPPDSSAFLLKQLLGQKGLFFFSFFGPPTYISRKSKRCKKPINETVRLCSFPPRDHCGEGFSAAADFFFSAALKRSRTFLVSP